MALGICRRHSNVGRAVVLKPISLVDAVEAHVISVNDVEFSKEFAILQGSRVKPH